MKSNPASETLNGIESVIESLVELLRDVAGSELPESFETKGPETIRELKLTSVRLLEFLVHVEDQLGVEWEEELDPRTVRSFEAMATYLLERREHDGLA